MEKELETIDQVQSMLIFRQVEENLSIPCQVEKCPQLLAVKTTEDCGCARKSSWSSRDSSKGACV